MATMTTTGRSSLSRITIPAHYSWPTTGTEWVSVCICRPLPSVHSRLPAHFIHSNEISYCMSTSPWLCHLLTRSRNRFKHIPMLPRTRPKVLSRCWWKLFLHSCQMSLCTCSESVLCTCLSVTIISYTHGTQHCGHRSHCSFVSHRSHHSHHSCCGHHSHPTICSYRRPLNSWVQQFVERRHSLHCSIVVLSP